MNDDVSPFDRPGSGMREHETKKELALAFYARALISAGKAAEMAGVSRREFEGWLAERRIERPLSDADLQADLDWARS